MARAALRTSILCSVLLAASLLAVTVAGAQFPAPENSTASEDVSLFGLPAPGADFETLSRFRLGNAVFRQIWTPAGDGPAHFDGLGPLFNAASCDACHMRDGRGRPVDSVNGNGDSKALSMLLKLGRPAGPGAPMLPDPVYGAQLQDNALGAIAPEGRVRADYEETTFTFADGEAVRLRRPRFSVVSPAYGPLAADTVISARIAPQMIGLGLLARVPETQIRDREDAEDGDGDGISGRVNLVDDGTGVLVAGRFGWKAAQPSIEAQISLALSRDMGLSTPRLPSGFGDCTEIEAACRKAPDGGSAEFEGLEAHSVIVDWAVAYSENLAVPARRGARDARIRAGEVLFSDSGCAKCHRPAFNTMADPDQPHLGDREIAPYSDLLLHDMGDDLADGFAEGLADGREWRTAPLWGIGLTAEVNGNMVFLHDGRARTVTEAIIWHGGEAEAAREAFAALNAGDRARLVAFVNSL